MLLNATGYTERGNRKKETFHLLVVLEQAEKHEMKKNKRRERSDPFVSGAVHILEEID